MEVFVVEVTEASTRRRLLDAAAGLLAASPSGDVSTRAVCEAAGVTSPTLYHHFGDKDSLLRAVVADGFERYLAVERARPSTGDPVEDLRRGWDRHVEFGLAHPQLYLQMYGRTSPDGRPAAQHMSPAADEAVDLLAGFLRAIDSRGRLGTDVAVAVQLTGAATVGITLLLIRQRATDPADPLSRMLRDAVLAALLVPGPAAEPRGTETALLRNWLAVLADAGGPPSPAITGDPA